MNNINLYYPVKIYSKDEIKDIEILYKFQDTYYILCSCDKLFYSNYGPPATIRRRFLLHNESRKHQNKKCYEIDEIKYIVSLNPKRIKKL